MRLFRGGQASWVAVLALALQASSSGYVPACPMKADAKAPRSCCHAQQAEAAMPACHAAKAAAPTAAAPTPKKACCFIGVMSPCADGAVAEARLVAPTTSAAPPGAAVPVTATWAVPPVPAQTAAPPGLPVVPATPPSRATHLLI